MGRVEYITDTMATTIVTHNAPRIQEENRRRPDSSGGTVLLGKDHVILLRQLVLFHKQIFRIPMENHVAFLVDDIKILILFQLKIPQDH